MRRMTTPRKLTTCQEKGLDVLARQGNVFLTGAAGTGKSFLLSEYLANKASAEFPVVASTGAAAVLVGGRTFHSFFGLGILEGGVAATIGRALRSGKLLYRLQRACCVVIDEISMLSGTQLLAADQIARRARETDKPWGGLRIIAVGDFAQLPPVTAGEAEKDWAFLHPVWKQSEFQPALLSTVMRTKDPEFLTILNHIRDGTVNNDVRTFLDEHTIRTSGTEEATRLYPHRAQAEGFNQERLARIPSRLRTFRTQYAGKERDIEAAKKSIPIPEVLHLKEGALVMMRKNDASGEYRYVNGTLGHVRTISDETLQIELTSGEQIDVSPDKFSCLNGDGQEIAAAWNFPVTLAWASTIHKAQGASLDRMIVDLHALWEPGQAYVALSRVRSGTGLFIKRWSASSIRAEPLVTAFYNGLADQATTYVPRPFFDVPKRAHEAPREKITRTAKRKQLTRVERMEQIRTMLLHTVTPEDISASLDIKVERVLLYVEHLIEAKRCPDLSYMIPLLPSYHRMAEAFRSCGFEHLRPAFDHLDGVTSWNDLRLTRCMLLAQARQIPTVAVKA